MVSYIVLFVLFILTFRNPWWWIAVVPVALWKVGQWYFYKGRPWRRIHYPMLRAYAAIAGQEGAVAEHNGRDFDIRPALDRLVRTVKPDWSEEKVHTLIQREFDRYADFSDRKLIETYLTKKHPKLTDAKIEEVMERCSKLLKTYDNGLMVRFVVAGIIEEQFGQEHRAEYLFELMSGNVD